VSPAGAFDPTTGTFDPMTRTTKYDVQNLPAEDLDAMLEELLKRKAEKE
jgi:hypothetical protein